MCVDFSEQMLQLCQQKGLKTQSMDIEEWNLLEHSTDALWAYACLLHVPKKNIHLVLQNIRKTLRPQGILGIAVKEGWGEHWETHEKYPDTKRLFVYFTDEEIRLLFNDHFELLHASRTDVKQYVFLNYVFRLL